MNRVQMAHVSTKLLDGSSAKGIAGSNQDAKIIFYKPKTDFG
jgi:hypothetical protein